MKFGNVLDIALDKNDLSVSQLASELNVTDRTVYRWLGNTNEPDFDTLCKICMILDIDFNEIIKIKHEEKTNIINIVQDKQECYLLELYRDLNNKQKKLYLKNAKLFAEALHLHEK
ncbi:helix-turn-helix transcriptional regulator [[Clostridium] innocuum]|uniref:helix-turn-helix transcriptional regulator n=1 Tax=Clostridium innocuum TaxID=1522 RepID=UPI001AF9BDB6|nr:helix-turn-helix transcriptional regulator [[Clostridium] innocuum]MDU1018770.1 helix-turn-helix transcriptional regulator [Bifidobacterium breve]QSI26867.1 helix-turn-helix domain-containing protein [Erysipelotrichaceae bacterium 66202529]MCC2831833.1 helix-turn-helix domain-containing protein [[Clostridium] innocuum]MCR0248549.1 helix-turn-helix domain-containing protein [[Clostridium] innocuum]MCR0261060.1 helix-turn-helix domain-containing protein [[Clostridium] innocuum]